MKEFLMVLLLALFITHLMMSYDVFNLHPEEHDAFEARPFNLRYNVTAKQGVIACLSKKAFEEYSGYAVQKNSTQIRQLMAEGVCVFFANGTELFSQEGACNEQNKNSDIFPFKTPGLESRFYMPCFAIR